MRNAANKGRVVLGLHFLAQVIPEVLTIVMPFSALDSAKTKNYKDCMWRK